MANVISDAASTLAAELDKVLPGRTTATPRTRDVGEAIWIDVPSLAPDKPMAARHVTADFPVWITSSGADHAQVAFLNDATAKVWDACDTLRLCYPIGSRPAPTREGEARAVIVTVRMLLKASGFCLPDPPTEAAIPPDPIPDPSEED